jgi:two-component system sensor histidine kinase HydH
LQTCNITQLIKRVIEDNNFPNDVKINVENADVKMNVDLTKMDAVMTNLLVNATQAIGNKGTINVRIIDDGANVMIAVEDSGPGIPQDQLTKIFEPLFTTKQTGTGLGLSICKKIVEQHGGNITAKNNPTTFIIRMPKNF